MNILIRAKRERVKHKFEKSLKKVISIIHTASGQEYIQQRQIKEIK